MTVYNIFEITAAIALVLGIIRYFTNKPENIFVTFLQDFVGSFFIFSGFVKAVDPLGTSYKMHEYFEAFASEGMRPLWEGLANYSTFFAIVMIAAELFVGLMLIIGWMPRFTVGVIWLLTLFFTYLTGYTYLSGYTLSLSALIFSGIAMLIFAAAAFPKKDSQRNLLVIVGVSVLVLMWAYNKATHHLFLYEFAENKMKVTDCGCFGDFIKLKPWQTFYKDVILDIIILVLLFANKQIQPLFGNRTRTGIAIGAATVSLFLCLYCTYLNEPIIDFRPYAIGNNIDELRFDKKPPIIETSWQCRLKGTDQWETITYDQVMKEGRDVTDPAKYDTNYRVDNVIDPGIPARVLGLNIEGEDDYITDTLLRDPNYSLMVVSWKLDETHEDAFKKLNEIQAGCEKAGIKFYAVVANNGHIDEFRHKNQTAYPFYIADETPIKTMMRSNPGLILLRKGVVVNKWHYMHFPTFGELNNKYFSK